MLDTFIIVSVLCIVDLILLVVMPNLYFSFGIPIFIGSINVKPDKTLSDVGVYIGNSENLVYKIRSDELLYRTKFTFSNLYRIGFLSIIKGKITLQDSQLHIVQRMNLTTVYFIFLMAFAFITQDIDVAGYIIAVIVLTIAILFHYIRILEIKKLIRYIETYINQDKRVANRWGD